MEKVNHTYYPKRLITFVCPTELVKVLTILAKKDFEDQKPKKHVENADINEGVEKMDSLCDNEISSK